MGKRLALVPLSILAVLLLAEGVLQLAAFFVQRSVRSELPLAARTDDLRILSLGDSNTYGLYLKREQAYPKQLETLWNATHASQRLEVLNLGFPGTNSSRVVRDFHRMLEAFEPDLVTVMVGVNDFWTAPFPLEPEGFRASNLLRRSRLYGIVLMGVRGRRLEVELKDKAPSADPWSGGARARYGAEEFDLDFAAADPGVEEARAGLARNLELLVERARDHGTRLVLVTYPADGEKLDEFYPAANQIIRRAAARTGTPLIDSAQRFLPLCPEVPCLTLFFYDYHPRAQGHHMVAEAIAEWLATELSRPADGG